MFEEYGSSDDGSDNGEAVYSAGFKMNLADEVIHNRTTAAKQARVHHIKRDTVNKWVSRLKIHHILYTGHGRPRALDSESMENVRETLAHNPTMSSEELRALLNLEHRETYNRTHPMSILDDLDDITGRKLQPKTMRNYINMFRKEVGVQQAHVVII